MFITVEVTNIVEIRPHEFQPAESTPEYLEKLLTTKLSRLYVNRILIGSGLVITIYEIISCGEGHIKPGTALTCFTMKFKLVCFRPLVDEVIVGKIASMSPEGIRVTLGFFDDIWIPLEGMKENSKYDVMRKCWVWDFDGTEMLYELDDEIRFRVSSEKFSEVVANPAVGDVAATEEVKHVEKSAYTVAGSVVEQGLGILDWW